MFNNFFDVIDVQKKYSKSGIYSGRNTGRGGDRSDAFGIGSEWLWELSTSGSAEIGGGRSDLTD